MRASLFLLDNSLNITNYYKVSRKSGKCSISGTNILATVGIVGDVVQVGGDMSHFVAAAAAAERHLLIDCHKNRESCKNRKNHSPNIRKILKIRQIPNHFSAYCDVSRSINAVDVVVAVVTA